MNDWWAGDSPVDKGDPYNVLPGAPRELTGDPYLKSLPPEMAKVVQGVTDYKINPNSLSIKGGHRERVLGSALRYDPSYEQGGYNAKAAMIKEFNSGGPSSPAGQITAGNTAIQHLHEMMEATKKLKEIPGLLPYVASRGIPFVSYAAAALKNASLKGTPEGQALADFMTASNHYSEEVTKFYSGSGGSEAERSRALANLDPAKSLPELLGAFTTEGKLMHGKINALQDRFKTGLGPKAWLTAQEGAGPEFPVVQKKTEEALKHILAAAEAKKPEGAGATPAPAVPDADGWIALPGGVRIKDVTPKENTAGR